jgi:hypothetical protein
VRDQQRTEKRETEQEDAAAASGMDPVSEAIVRHAQHGHVGSESSWPICLSVWICSPLVSCGCCFTRRR